MRQLKTSFVENTIICLLTSNTCNVPFTIINAFYVIWVVHNFNDVFWTEIKVPFSPYWICVSDIGIFCGVEKLEIWRSLTKLPPLQWIKESCRSLRMSISQSGNIRWKLDFGVAYAYLAANNSGTF